CAVNEKKSVQTQHFGAVRTVWTVLMTEFILDDVTLICVSLQVFVPPSPQQGPVWLVRNFLFCISGSKGPVWLVRNFLFCISGSKGPVWLVRNFLFCISGISVSLYKCLSSTHTRPTCVY